MMQLSFEAASLRHNGKSNGNRSGIFMHPND